MWEECNERGGRAVRRLLAALLAYPRIVVLAMLLCVIAPTALQLHKYTSERAQRGGAAGAFFDLRFDSLRVVTGLLSDRQDAFNLMSAPGLDSSLFSLSFVAPPPAAPPTDGRRLEEASGEASSALRGIQVLYTRRGARTASGITGDMLVSTMVERAREVEAAVVSATGSKLVGLYSILPCLHADEGGAHGRVQLRPQCNGTLMGAAWHLSSGCHTISSSGAFEHPCVALRSFIEVDASADFMAWIVALEGLSTDAIEVSWRGDGFLFWQEMYRNLYHDLSFTAVSVGALMLVMISVLRVTLFAIFSLFVIALTFPVALCIYTGAFGLEQVPVLAVVSVFLVLGIGADAIFAFTNTYALEESERQRRFGSGTQFRAALLRQHSSSSSLAGLDTAAVPAAKGGVGKQAQPGELRSSEVEVLMRTLRSAGAVTSCAMVTTAVSFGASINSSISTIRQFALFQTLCVAAEYALLLLLFVPAMVAWRRSFFCAQEAGKAGIPTPAPGVEGSERRPAATCRRRLACCRNACAEFARSFRVLRKPLRLLLLPATPSFWSEAVAPCMHRARYVLFGAWLVVCGLQANYTLRLQPSTTSPQLFDSDHNLERAPYILRHAFNVITPQVGATTSQVHTWLWTPEGQVCLHTCAYKRLADGVCDPGCNVQACHCDAGDCAGDCPEASLAGEGNQAYGATSDAGDATAAVIAGVRRKKPPFPPAPPPALPAPPTAPPPPQCIPEAEGSGLQARLDFEQQCSGHGKCLPSGECDCIAGFSGPSCEELVDADGARLKQYGESDVAQVTFVWGIEPKPSRGLIDGVAHTASLDRSQRLLSAQSQRLAVALCDFLEREAPPWHVRPGSVHCPMARLRERRAAAGRSWPVADEAEALYELSQLAKSEASEEGTGSVAGYSTNAHVGLDRDVGATVGWMAVSLHTNVLRTGTGSSRALLDSANWFEGVSDAHNAAAAASGAPLVVWQTSKAYAWMEVMNEAVGGTAAVMISGSLLTVATLIIFTRSVQLALATMGGVLVVLACFMGYLVQRGGALGVMEAIAATIFIGFSCDYAVHVLQAHRNGGHRLAVTLAHAGPSLTSAALTTAGAAAPLLFARIMLFRTFAEYIIVCTVLSLAVSLTLIAPLIDICTARETPRPVAAQAGAPLGAPADWGPAAKV